MSNHRYYCAAELRMIDQEASVDAPPCPETVEVPLLSCPFRREAPTATETGVPCWDTAEAARLALGVVLADHAEAMAGKDAELASLRAKLAEAEAQKNTLWISRDEEYLKKHEYLDALRQKEATIAARDKRIAELTAGLGDLVMFYRLSGEDALEHFERVAEQFYRDTGYLRPGKDCRLHGDDVRCAKWDEWVDAKVARARALIAGEVLTSPRDGEGDAR